MAGALSDGITAATLQKENGPILDAAGLFCRLDRVEELCAGCVCHAQTAERTASAERGTVWNTYGFTQFHDSLREV